MTSSEIINTAESIAVIGVSRDKKKFGNIIYRELRDRNMNVFPVNPLVNEIEGFPCVPDIKSLKNIPELVILVVKPPLTLQLIKENMKRDIKHFWLQPGAQSPEVIQFCKENNIPFTAGKCVLMYLEPVKGIHSVHRFFNKLFGKY